MNTRRLGALDVAGIGFGCMNLSHAYGVPPSADAARMVLYRALDLGVTHFDTAALYGFGRNEELVGEVLKPFRQRIHLASKCGLTGVDGKRVMDGRPETLKRTCLESLRRLQTDAIDLYYLHRWDRRVPIEESVGALGDMVTAGWIRGIGLSEVSAATLRKAHAVHPITAVQSEYSLWTRNPETALLDECRTLGITLIAFSPLGRGFLAGGVTDPAKFVDKDIRRTMPRFCEPHFSTNRRLLAHYSVLAREAGCTMAQLALAWLLHKSQHVIPIPGTTSVAHLEENLGAAAVTPGSELICAVEALINPATIDGARYSQDTQLEIDTEEFRH